MIGNFSVFRIKLLQKRLELPVIQTFAFYEVDYTCYGAHNMFHLQSFATQLSQMDDTVTNCKLTCIFLPHLLQNPVDQSTLLITHGERTICPQSHKFISSKAYFSYTFGYLFKDIISCGCAMHRF